MVWCGVVWGEGGGEVIYKIHKFELDLIFMIILLFLCRDVVFYSFLHTRFFCRLVGFSLIYGENLHVLMKELQLKWLANDTLASTFFESFYIKVQGVARTAKDRTEISQGTDGFGSRRSVHHRLKRNDKGE